MTNTTHTPGPWMVHETGFYTNPFKITARGKHGAVANIPHSEITTTARQSANARLIAAAPDLLAALDQVDAYLSPFDGEEDAYAEIRSVIRQAIAKAKGK